VYLREIVLIMKPTPLILLHGALGSRDQFSRLKESLDGHFQVYDLNFSGHGGNEVVEPFAMDVFVNDVLDLMRLYNLKKANFFGYSMGGYVALKVAAKFPQKVAGIITLATKFKWDKESAEKEVQMLDPEKVVLKVPEFAATLSQRHGNHWKKVMINTGTMMLGLGNGQAMTVDDFKCISCPVTIAIGDMDRMVTMEESREVANQLQFGKLKILENVKHPLEGVDSQLLREMIINFTPTK